MSLCTFAADTPDTQCSEAPIWGCFQREQGASPTPFPNGPQQVPGPMARDAHRQRPGSSLEGSRNHIPCCLGQASGFHAMPAGACLPASIHLYLNHSTACITVQFFPLKWELFSALGLWSVFMRFNTPKSACKMCIGMIRMMCPTSEIPV